MTTLKYQVIYRRADYNAFTFNHPYAYLEYFRHNEYHRDRGPAMIHGDGRMIRCKYGENIPNVDPNAEPINMAKMLQ
jgi:hypothetical protein